MKNISKEHIKKLNQDDILRILVRHFQEEIGESWGYGELLGTPNKDLRFIGIFSTDDNKTPSDYDIEQIDSNTDFNDDWSMWTMRYIAVREEHSKCANGG